MYFSTSISYIIILSPLILLALLATIGIVLYRHPSKLQRKWYSISFKKRKLPFESRQGMGGKYERFSSKLRKFFTEISAHRF